MGARTDVQTLKSAIQRFWRCQSGEGMEYGLVAGMITILLIAGMAASGDGVRGTYNGLSNVWGDSLDDLQADGMTTAPATLDE